MCSFTPLVRCYLHTACHISTACQRCPVCAKSLPIYLPHRSGGKAHWVQQDKLETWEVLTQPEMIRWLMMTCQRAHWQTCSIKILRRR